MFAPVVANAVRPGITVSGALTVLIVTVAADATDAARQAATAAAAIESLGTGFAEFVAHDAS
jgi:hypothetical protein